MTDQGVCTCGGPPEACMCAYAAAFNESEALKRSEIDRLRAENERLRYELADVHRDYKTAAEERTSYRQVLETIAWLPDRTAGSPTALDEAREIAQRAFDEEKA